MGGYEIAGLAVLKAALLWLGSRRRTAAPVSLLRLAASCARMAEAAPPTAASRKYEVRQLLLCKHTVSTHPLTRHIAVTTRAPAAYALTVLLSLHTHPPRRRMFHRVSKPDSGAR